MQLLIKHGATVEAPSPYTLHTEDGTPIRPLRLSLLLEYFDAADALIKGGASVNATWGRGCDTALHSAIRAWGAPTSSAVTPKTLVTALLDAAADPNAAVTTAPYIPGMPEQRCTLTFANDTPLHAAVRQHEEGFKGAADLCALLLERGADPSARMRYLQTRVPGSLECCLPGSLEEQTHRDAFDTQSSRPPSALARALWVQRDEWLTVGQLAHEYDGPGWAVDMSEVLALLDASNEARAAMLSQRRVAREAAAAQSEFLRRQKNLVELAKAATQVHLISTPWTIKAGRFAAAAEKRRLHKPPDVVAFDPNDDIATVADFLGWSQAQQEKKWLEIFNKIMMQAQK